MDIAKIYLSHSCRWCKHIRMPGTTPEAFVKGINNAFCVYGATPKDILERGIKGTLMKDIDKGCIMFEGTEDYEEQSRILERSF